MKTIRFGMLEGSIGDAITLLPVANNSDFTLEATSYHSRIQIFQHNCKVEITDKLTLEQESIEKYGAGVQREPYLHAALNFLKVFGVETEDPLPSMNLLQEELEFGEDWIKSRFSEEKQVLVFSPTIAGLKENFDDCRRFRFLPTQYWEWMIEKLSARFEMVYTCQESDFIPLKGNYIRLHLPVRQTAAVLRAAGLFLGVDSGIHHLSVANGVQTFVLVPTRRFGPGYCFTNYCYEDPSFWKKRERTASYATFGQFVELTNHICAHF